MFDSDLSPWVDSSSHAELTLHPPSELAYTVPKNAPASYSALLNSTNFAALAAPSVNAIFGIGADNPPEPDPTYWRTGYTYPVQITNWASSMAPHHPVADQFLETLRETIFINRNHLLSVDPLDITGPPALTAAIQRVALKSTPELSWDALSARNGDPVGGRGKLVAGDTLILPITGFHPGRGWFHNMGSQSITHPNARLRHAAAGSWRNMGPEGPLRKAVSCIVWNVPGLEEDIRYLSQTFQHCHRHPRIMGRWRNCYEIASSNDYMNTTGPELLYGL